MIFTSQKCTYLTQEPGLEGIYKHIEKCGRTCYRSLDRITKDSAKPFVERMIKSNHTAMLEHAAVYLCVKNTKDNFTHKIVIFNHYSTNKYSEVRTDSNNNLYITTNYRVIIENGWEKDLEYLCNPTEFHAKRYTLLCTTALHCYKDLTRHRTLSFAIESTRYCNYLLQKFSNSLTYITPTWYNKSKWYQKLVFKAYLKFTEFTYMFLTKFGWKAQEAAEVLPQCIKGDMVVSGFEKDLKHLLDLRYKGTTGAPHPMVKELAELMKLELEKQGFIYQ